jgi:hypothetical protein
MDDAAIAADYYPLTKMLFFLDLPYLYSSRHPSLWTICKIHPAITSRLWQRHGGCLGLAYSGVMGDNRRHPRRATRCGRMRTLEWVLSGGAYGVIERVLGYGVHETFRVRCLQQGLPASAWNAGAIRGMQSRIGSNALQMPGGIDQFVWPDLLGEVPWLVMVAQNLCTGCRQWQSRHVRRIRCSDARALDEPYPSAHL